MWNQKGVGIRGGGVNSNDILAAIQYPDPSTGKLGSQQDKYLTDALGDVVQSTDRNGTVHQYSYDVLGRLTADKVTTLGTGVDGTVRQITYGYGSQGNLSLITSLDANSNILNQVERTFNGLGQLTDEYQSHNGEVDIPLTPAVHYAYNEMSGGQNNSRLVDMVYPDNYELYYHYNSGLDNTISRLSSISDSTGTLESYLYLGLNTVVERDHPQSGVNLTYIKQSGIRSIRTVVGRGLSRTSQDSESRGRRLMPKVVEAARGVRTVCSMGRAARSNHCRSPSHRNGKPIQCKTRASS